MLVLVFADGTTADTTSAVSVSIQLLLLKLLLLLLLLLLLFCSETEGGSGGAVVCRSARALELSVLGFIVAIVVSYRVCFRYSVVSSYIT